MKRMLKLDIRGASHAKKMTFSLENFPAGVLVDEKKLAEFMERRAPGRDKLSTARREADEVVFTAGVKDGVTTGAAIVGEIASRDMRPSDYGAERTIPRPGHADFGQWIEMGRIPTGGGKNSGYSQDKGMEGGEGASRRDTKVSATDKESTRSQLTRNAEAAYAQAQLNNLKTYDLKKYIAFSRKIEMLEKQNASPAMIEELHKKAIKALTSTYASLENGITSADMGAVSETESDEEGVAASPDEAPAEYREMVSDYFKAIGELK